MTPFKRVLVTGGAGYVGARLVPKLLDAGHEVTVLDLCLYGREVLDGVAQRPGFALVQGDLRSAETVAGALTGCDAVVHLACISNDPSFELDPDLGRSINYDCFRPLVEGARAAGVRRFVYASSSSVYGVKADDNVTEDLPLEPLTDYSRYKALCEGILAEYNSPEFVTVTLRPATVCGWSPRLRLDLVVNIFAAHAYHRRAITVHGGTQRRPNIHIEDVTDLYVELLARADAEVAGRVWNAGWQNLSLNEIAACVRAIVGDDVTIANTPTDDLRSYHISSARIHADLGYAPRRTVEDAVRDVVTAFAEGRVPDAMGDPRYHNIRTMQRLGMH